jgi:hypothetical protein
MKDHYFFSKARIEVLGTNHSFEALPASFGMPI